MIVEPEPLPCRSRRGERLRSPNCEPPRIWVDQGAGGIGASLVPADPNSFEGDARSQMRLRCS